jgi:hypothetical protein
MPSAWKRIKTTTIGNPSFFWPDVRLRNTILYPDLTRYPTLKRLLGTQYSGSQQHNTHYSNISSTTPTTMKMSLMTLSTYFIVILGGHMLSVVMLSVVLLYIIMLSFIELSVFILCIVKLSVVMVSVKSAHPAYWIILYFPVCPIFLCSNKVCEYVFWKLVRSFLGLWRTLKRFTSILA